MFGKRSEKPILQILHSEASFSCRQQEFSPVSVCNILEETLQCMKYLHSDSRNKSQLLHYHSCSFPQVVLSVVISGLAFCTQA